MLPQNVRGQGPDGCQTKRSSHSQSTSQTKRKPHRLLNKRLKLAKPNRGDARPGAATIDRLRSLAAVRSAARPWPHGAWPRHMLASDLEPMAGAPALHGRALVPGIVRGTVRTSTRA